MPHRVLVVDDVELNVKLLEAKLASEYFEVTTAYNGHSALELAEAEPPDIILLDVMMPRMDGLTFLAAARVSFGTFTLDKTAYLSHPYAGVLPEGAAPPLIPAARPPD